MGFSEDRAQGKFGPYYLLVAENPYVLWDAAEHWKSVWKRQAPRVETFTAPHIDFEHLLGAGATMPMFETIQPVLINQVDKLTGKKFDELIRIIKQSSSSAKWLLTAESVDKRTASYKALAALGPVELFKNIYPEQLGGWVQRIAGDFEATLAPAAVELIASVHGSDLFEARQTVERAVLYIGRKQRIEVNDVETVMAGEGEYDVFQLLEASSRRDFARALTISRSLAASKKMSSEVSLWLSMIHGQCLRLLQILELGKASNEHIGQALHIHPFLVSKLRVQASGFGYNSLVQAVSSAFEADWAIKTSTIQPLLAWELFVWKISQDSKKTSIPLMDLDSVRGRD